MIVNIIIKLYISTVMATIIAFVLNYRRLDRYYRKQGLKAIFNEDSLFCLILCFIPIINIIYGMLYWNGSRFTADSYTSGHSVSPAKNSLNR